MSGSGPDGPAELARQFSEAADRLMRGWSAAAPAGRPTPPMTLSAQQLRAVLDDIAARRSQIQSLRDALGAFDEQLGALETSLAPLLAWTEAWADVEGRMTDPWRQPPRSTP